MASTATHAGKDPSSGNHIMIAGLSVQVFTLFLFICLSSDFAFKTWRRVSTLGKQQALDPTHAKLRASFRFRGFLAALVFATLCIFTRSVYRVAELSEGWSGHLIETQRYFIGLEGAIVAAGVLALNAFHPGLCFRQGYQTRAEIAENDQSSKAVDGRAGGVEGSDTPSEKAPSGRETRVADSAA
jgi:hypothetical protein